MSVRGIGESHVSSVQFRTGYVATGEVTVDDPGQYLTEGARRTAVHHKGQFIDRLTDLGVDHETARQLVSELPETFHEDALRSALAGLHPHLLNRNAIQQAIQFAGYLASNTYEVEFPDEVPLTEQLLWPTGSAESHGIEDVRLVRFTEDDGVACYQG